MPNFLQLLKSELSCPVNEKQAGYLDRMMEVGDQLLEMTDTVVDLLRIEAGNMVINREPFSVKMLLEDITERLTRLARKKQVTWELDIEPDIPRSLILDQARLCRVVENLIKSGVKTAEPAHVRIKMGRQTKGKIQFSVSLKGEANLDDKQHTSGPADGVMKQNRPDPGLAAAKGVARYLTHKGHSVSRAATGNQVLEAIGRESFDLILMDVSMPEKDGVEATRQIRNSKSDFFDPHIKIIALTGYGDKSERKKFRQTGMDDYILKPVDFDSLIKKINQVIQGRQMPI